MRRVGEYPLWIGNARDARDIRAVLDAGIEAVVDLAIEEPPVHPTRELVYLRFPLMDGGGNPVWVLHALTKVMVILICEQTPTLVACSNGMSRSPCVAAIALGKATGRSVHQVLEELGSTGPLDVSPLLWADLLHWEL